MKNNQKKVRGEESHQSDQGTVIDFDIRKANIQLLSRMTTTARDDALGLDLKFEAYLLDMALIAINEHLEK